MFRISLKTAATALTLAGVLSISGCVSSETRMPRLGWDSARAELRNQEYHDPLPETDVGPFTSARPRGFTTARSEPRRALEGSTKIRGQGYRPSSDYPAVVPQ